MPRQPSRKPATPRERSSSKASAKKPSAAKASAAKKAPAKRSTSTRAASGKSAGAATRGKSIGEIHALLVTRRDALRRALTGDLSLLKQLREQSGSDVVDAALDAAQDEISSQLAEVESRELGSIEKALGRIREGVYGLCEVCAKRIPMARLKALPYATLCIECQQASEDGTLDDRRNEDWSRVADAGYTNADVRVSDLELR